MTNINIMPQSEPVRAVDNDLSQFVNTSLVDVLVERIRANIYTGAYEPGKKLIVRELSEEFSVSHTPIKDALNRLMAEGYVEAMPRRSMRVRVFTNNDLIESLQVRLMLEIFSADEILEAASKDPSIASEMRDILEKMQACIDEKADLDYEKWVGYETLFHNCYMDHCGNAKSIKIYQDLNTNRMTYFTYLSNSHTPLKLSSLEKNMREHQAIFDALLALDTQRFVDAVIAHVCRAVQDYEIDEESRRRIQQLNRMAQKYKT